MKDTHRAFTLIELLIIMAIIGILTAIAVPNFLEAMVRAKNSRVKADMRSLAIGIEAYTTDNNCPPYSQLPPGNRDWLFPGGFPTGVPGAQCAGLTTPIGYISSPMIDVYDVIMPYPAGGGNYYNALHYVGRRFGFNRGVEQVPMTVMVPTDSANGAVAELDGSGADLGVQHGINGAVPTEWALYSHGPDARPFLDTNGDGTADIESIYNLNNRYDPTNGSGSAGNVIRLPGNNFPG